MNKESFKSIPHLSLEQRIRDRIEQKGYLPIDEYLNFCLYDPLDGYYNKRDVIGRKGDFITSPEISQIFGELIGLFLIAQWSYAGQSQHLQIIEYGPGRGTLAIDILRTIKHIPVMRNVVRTYHMIEKSPILRGKQKKALANYTDVFWHDSLKDVPQSDAYQFIIANEFFDALPIKQFTARNDRYEERLVVIDPVTKKLSFTHVQKENIYEDCYSYKPFINDINESLSKTIGSAIIIDYGDLEENRLGDTLQGMKDHRYMSILENPGTVDISHHVNFKLLSELFLPCFYQEPIETQGTFLQKIGIEMRMAQLLKRATDQQKIDIMTACTRLISPQHMGTLFKVLFVRNYD
jgi:NADH dehydrogenase [ubiquinone] 1 alpha subcomplex assembly factor 7